VGRLPTAAVEKLSIAVWHASLDFVARQEQSAFYQLTDEGLIAQASVKGKKYSEMEQTTLPQRMRQPFTLAVALFGFGCSDARVTDEPVSEERLELVDFTTPLFTEAREFVVTGPGGLTLSSRDDISGQTIWVRGSSGYHESLVRLNEEPRAAERPEVVVRKADENLERDPKEEGEAAEAEQETNTGGTEDQLSSPQLEDAFLRRLVALGWLR
jgi:hypothetical protein